MSKHTVRNKKGFTLMEILFVVLVIALVVSFAMPAIRSVRFDIKNARAKAALKKVAEARRHYYESTRGGDFAWGTTFDMGSAQSYAEDTCTNQAASGVPGSASADTSDDKFRQLFACGFLNWQEFVDLPYTVHFCDIGSDSASELCPADHKRYVSADAGTGATEASVGKKYIQPYYMYIDIDDMQVKDNDND